MAATRTELPTGTVTFLRTDVEGSMRLARELGSAWDELNARQLALIREAVTGHDGVEVRTEGDAMFAVFADARAAARAAIAVQRALAAADRLDGTTVSVRIGLHSGEAHLAGDDYGGFDVNRAARIAAVGHGGQIVVSDPTRALVASDLPDGVELRDLGRHALRDVPQPERLFQLEAPGLRTDFPPIRSGAAATGNLPGRLTSLVGRERELDELERLLDRSRLVTITGPGGIGKTSLGLELARRRAPDFPDGAWFVALDVVSDAALVSSAIARTLGLYDGPGRPAGEGVARHLAERTALLVLDNFEHLLAAAPETARLLQAAPDVRIVVTSRAPLRIGGEQDYPLGPLEARGGPEGPSTAERLFLERAEGARPGWSATADHGVVGEICTLLDGLPLGLELAAARVGILPASAIRDRLAARLPLPGSGRRDVPDRQRTTDSAIGWSYELLPAGHRGLLRVIAVFEGGVDLEQAEAVAGADGAAGGDGAIDVLDGLVELADQSLVERDRVADDGSRLGGVRFRMLETIRTFALRRLAEAGEERDVRERHARAFLGLAERFARQVPGTDQARWLDRMAEDHGNLRAAVQWAIDAGETELAQRLAAALWRYWQLGGHLREGRALADAVVAMPRADEPSAARLWSLAAAGGMAYWQGDTAAAHERYLEQLAVARQIGDQAGEADALFNLSSTWFIVGNLNTSEEMLEEAARAYARVGDEVGLARIGWARSNVLWLGRTASGEQIAELLRLHEDYTARGDAMYAALTEGSLSWVYMAIGRRDEALRWGARTISSQHALRDVASTVVSLAGFAIGLLQFGQPEEAATTMGAFNALCEVHGVRPPAGLGFIIEQARLPEVAVQALDAEIYRQAVERGQRMSLDEIVAFLVQAIVDLHSEAAPDGA